MSDYICPCRCCPRCHGVVDVSSEPDGHPQDGLAFGCQQCGFRAEWWATAGPFMDGRHITSAEEEAAWRAHDAAVLARTVAETGTPRL